MVEEARQLLPVNPTLAEDDNQDGKDNLYMSAKTKGMNSVQKYGDPKKFHLLDIFLPSFQFFYRYGYIPQLHRMRWLVEV